MLRGQDGFTVMCEMRHGGQFIPTLMLTARGHPEDVLRGFAAGADDYLTKPFELAILIARIQGLLRRREWLRASLNHEAPNHNTANQTNHVTAPPEPKGTFAFGEKGEKSVHFDLL